MLFKIIVMQKSNRQLSTRINGVTLFNVWTMISQFVRVFHFGTKFRVVVFLLGIFSGFLAQAQTDELSALRVRNIPSSADTWEKVRETVLSGISPKISVVESNKSLTLSQGAHSYQVMLYNGDIIQYSTLTLAELQIEESIQFGRSENRRISPYLQFVPFLKEAHEVLKKAGVVVRETDFSKTTEDFRSALIYPTDGSTPFIALSARYSKHPIIGFAHESQHFLNQPLLPQLVDELLKRHSPSQRQKNSFRSFLDEYLALSAEIEAWRELRNTFPHLANSETMQIEKMPESELKSYVFNKWRSYYQWPSELLEILGRVHIDSPLIRGKIRKFHQDAMTTQKFSKELSRLVEFEQNKNPKVLDEAIIASPKNNHMPWLYRPESGQSFPIRTIWVPEKDLSIAMDREGLPEVISHDIIRAQDGERFHAIFIHPLSEEKYSDMIRSYSSSFEFVATPSSSNRTLLVQSTRTGNTFYVKTSLAVELAGVERTVPRHEVSRSVGHSIFLKHIAELDSRIIFLPEPIAQIPKGMDRGGQVIRMSETNVKTGQLLPLFSFYDTSDGKDWVGDIASKNGTTRSEFLKSRLVLPLFSLLTDLKDRYDFVHEAHAQNVLVEVDSKMVPTGRFVFKDLAGLTANLSKYPKVMEKMPFFTSRRVDYCQDDLEKAFKQSLEIYFKSGFLYGIDQYLRLTDPTYLLQKHLTDLEYLKNEMKSNSMSCQRMF